MLFLPDLLESTDRWGREAGSIRAEKGLEGVRESSCRDASQVEPRQQLLHALGPTKVARHDLRLEPKPVVLRGFTVPNAGDANGDAANPGLDLPLRQVAVANQPSGFPLCLELCQERLDLGFERLSQQATRSLANDLSQRIPGPGLRVQLDDGILLHGGVSLPSWVNLGFKIQDTPPFSSHAVHNFRP